MESVAVTLIVLSSLAFFAAVGGCISHQKNRRPLEGFVFGAVLGPIGLIYLSRMPFAHRPMVDQGAWNSFRSMVNYQSNPTMLQLTDASTRSSASRPKETLL